LIWIISDAARAMNFSLYGYRRKTSPNLNRISKSDGIVFENAYSVINATDPSITSMLSGTYPVTHGIRHHGGQVKEGEIKTLETRGILFLQEYLLEQGYTTVSFDILSRWHRRGFKEYIEILPKSDKLKTGLVEKIARHDRLKSLVKIMYKHLFGRSPVSRFVVLNAETVFEMAMERLRSENNPFFYFIHLWDTHTPYSVPDEYVFSSRGGVPIEDIVETLKNEDWRNYLLSSFSGLTTGEIIGKYDGAIRFVDEKFAEFVDFLKDKGFYENTVIIFTADHGESLIEHGIYFDHHGLYDVSLNVPLVILNYPGVRGRRRGLVQHIDLLPALAELFRVPLRHSLDGRNILELAEKGGREFIVFEENHTEVKRGIQTRRWKYVYAPDPEKAICRLCGVVHGGVEELYDLRVDKEETTNLVEESPHVASILRETLADWYSTMEKRGEKLALKRIAKQLRGPSKAS